MPDEKTAALAAELGAILRLATPPVGIAFRDSEETPGVDPVGLQRPAPTEDGRTGAVAAPCVFWTLGTTRVFSTVEADHANCSVGSYTHGFKRLDEIATKADVAALVRSGWVGEADFPHVPAVKDKPGSIVYGPLDALPVPADVVYLRLSPLSGGEQQMLVIARAMMARPRVLLLDEPSLGLAPVVVDRVFGMIAGLKAAGLTILLVEQNARKALSVADRAYVMRLGRIEAAGLAAELGTADALKALYLGSDA